ncbi:protein CHROMATIN REMODELING 20-like isoform X2 [Sesamum indicum]|uniref:Protein CHROMATIN REMODELING 20-like isoform X2 n=1 Tax=Sesamum indicum TaxID=4182 RepID=A0A6I9UR96_SESIN|nr:protein CHROMATIN REMODELING 20-like isoform X2 [Sesamum indicum]
MVQALLFCQMLLAEKRGNPHRKFGNAFIYMDWWREFLQDNTYKEVNYSGKMVLLLDILTMCSYMGDKALVFSQSLLTLDLIEFYLSKLPRPAKNGKCWKKRKDWYRCIWILLTCLTLYGYRNLD